MSLRVINSTVSTNSITITFSEQVSNLTTGTGAANPANYTIFDPGSVDFSHPQSSPSAVANFSLDANNLYLTITFSPSAGANEFQPGDWVHVTVSGVTALNGDTLEGGQVSFARQVPGGSTSQVSRRMTRDVEDAVTYPILTESVRFPRSGGGPTSGASLGNGTSTGQTAALAIGDVLGWKTSSTDPKGFVGALTQAFTLTNVEGHVESAWNPRTYAVQTDLGGGITGAQASLYTRAKDALDQSLSLLDGLYPLDPDADPEYVKALREMARSQMTEIVREFGAVGLPSILRIDTYFQILLGQHPAYEVPVQFDPDQIKGTLGQLRDTYGIYFRGNPFNNSIEDEQDITNFRVISDYMTSLMQSWIANREFFIVAPNRVAFFGTQLVLISRQLNVIAETIDEARFVLDSVFIGPNERQTLLLRFRDRALPPMFLEDVFDEIDKFVKDEGPRLLRDGGKISVTNNILPVVRSLSHMIEEAHDPANMSTLPDGFKTARVRHAFDDLHDQLGELIRLTTQVEQQVPFPIGDLRITGLIAGSSAATGYYTLSILGGGFDYRAVVDVHSLVKAPVGPLMFYSAERIDITFNPASIGLAEGSHDIRVTNPDGESATLTNAFVWDSTTGTITVSAFNGTDGQSFYGASTASPGPTSYTFSGDAPATATTSGPFGGTAPPSNLHGVTEFNALNRHVDQMKTDLDHRLDRLEDQMSQLLELNKRRRPRNVSS